MSEPFPDTVSAGPPIDEDRMVALKALIEELFESVTVMRDAVTDLRHEATEAINRDGSID
jgi:hypothetical protein